MAAINKILDLFKSLDWADQLSLAHSILDEISCTTKIKPENPDSIDLNEPPFNLFPQKPKDYRVTQFLLWVWKESSPEDTNLNNLASKVGLSYERIRHLCTEHIGLPVSQAIKMMRLEKCRNEFRQLDKNITEVALDFGFENPSSFSRMFKENFGETPTNYRQMCHNGQMTNPAQNQPEICRLRKAKMPKINDISK